MKMLSIIIASYRQPDLLRVCINSIKEATGEVDYEIIVSDGETGEKTSDLMREEFPQIRFFKNVKNIGFAAMVNQGIRVAQGKFILIINADIIFKPKGIERLLKYIEKNSTIGMIGPQLINFDGSIQQSCFLFYTLWTIVFRRTWLKRLSFAKKHLARFEMKRKQQTGKPLEVDWLMGSVMMVRKEAIKKVGLLDDRFFMYMEDVDWCWRMWQNGYKVVYYPKIKVFHYHGKASGNKNLFLELVSPIFNKYTRYHISSAIKFFWKHRGEKKPH